MRKLLFDEMSVKDSSSVSMFLLSTLSLDLDVQNMQDELEDLMEQANEVQEVMGRSYGMPEVDDDELEAELDALGDEIGLDEDATYLDDAIGAPSAPTSEPGADSMRVSNILVTFLTFALPLGRLLLLIFG